MVLQPDLLHCPGQRLHPANGGLGGLGWKPPSDALLRIAEYFLYAWYQGLPLSAGREAPGALLVFLVRTEEEKHLVSSVCRAHLPAEL